SPAGPAGFLTRRAAIRGHASVAPPAPEIVRDPISQPLLPLVLQISFHGGSQELLHRNVPELNVQLAQLPRQRGESLVLPIARERRIHILIRVYIFPWRECWPHVSRQDACHQKGMRGADQADSATQRTRNGAFRQVGEQYQIGAATQSEAN